MTRTAGATLWRTAGGAVVIALGFGALSSSGQGALSVSAAAATPRLSTPVREVDSPVPHHARDVVTIYTEEVPLPPPPTLHPPSTASARPAAARGGQAWSTGFVSGAANGFAYGYCTWWVAHKRNIPWRGNAYQWWWNARAFGFSEGAPARGGAIMVMGISGTSPQGHVGYVERVNPDGSFLVSEMDWWGVPGGGWGRVDYRTVTSMRGIIGFIY